MIQKKIKKYQFDILQENIHSQNDAPVGADMKQIYRQKLENYLHSTGMGMENLMQDYSKERMTERMRGRLLTAYSQAVHIYSPVGRDVLASELGKSESQLNDLLKSLRNRKVR